MPTSTGKPKVGETIRVAKSMFDKDNPEWVYGLVTKRTDGLGWSLRWIPEDETRERMLGEAQWMMSKGYLQIVPEWEVKARKGKEA